MIVIETLRKRLMHEITVPPKQRSAEGQNEHSYSDEVYVCLRQFS